MVSPVFDILIIDKSCRFIAFRDKSRYLGALKIHVIKRNKLDGPDYMIHEIRIT